MQELPGGDVKTSRLASKNFVTRLRTTVIPWPTHMNDDSVKPASKIRWPRSVEVDVGERSALLPDPFHLIEIPAPILKIAYRPALFNPLQFAEVKISYQRGFTVRCRFIDDCIMRKAKIGR